MTKRLSVVGNSLGLIIEKPILELLKIDRSTEFEMTTDGELLIFRPIRDQHRERVSKIHQKVMKRHGSTFKKLAE